MPRGRLTDAHRGRVSSSHQWGVELGWEAEVPAGTAIAVALCLGAAGARGKRQGTGHVGPPREVAMEPRMSKLGSLLRMGAEPTPASGPSSQAQQSPSLGLVCRPLQSGWSASGASPSSV